MSLHPDTRSGAAGDGPATADQGHAAGQAGVSGQSARLEAGYLDLLAAERDEVLGGDAEGDRGRFLAQQTLSSAQISVPHGSGPSVPPSAPGRSGGVKSHLCAVPVPRQQPATNRQDSEDRSKRHFHPPGSQTLNRWPPAPTVDRQILNIQDQQLRPSGHLFSHPSDMKFAGSMHRAEPGGLLVAEDMPIFANRRPAGHRTVGPRRNLARLGGPIALKGGTDSRAATGDQRPAFRQIAQMTRQCLPATF